MRVALRGSFAARVLVAACCAVSLPVHAGHAPAPLVIVLSWDGVRHDYPDRVELPGLARLAKDGARAQRLVPGWPSNTFPGHVTLATGAWVDVHGIVDNQFYDRRRGDYSYSGDASWITAEPLWIAAERQGIKAATFFWVGSETDWHGRGATHRIAPFDAGIGEARKVDQILSWIDLPAAERPGLIMSWWHGADDAGHEHGPDDPAVAQALRDQDSHLVRLLDAIDVRELWSTTTLIIVSDHGMTPIHRFYDAAATLEETGIRGRIVGGGAVAHAFLDRTSDADRLIAAYEADGLRAYRGDALPTGMHLAFQDRAGDVVLLAEPPVSIGAPAWYLEALFTVLHRCCGFDRGGHGYDPSSPDMGAVMLAIGRGVAPGTRLGAIPQIDIAPTVAHLLGIEPPANATGKPIPQLMTRRSALPSAMFETHSSIEETP